MNELDYQPKSNKFTLIQNNTSIKKNTFELNLNSNKQCLTNSCINEKSIIKEKKSKALPDKYAQKIIDEFDQEHAGNTNYTNYTKNTNNISDLNKINLNNHNLNNHNNNLLPILFYNAQILLENDEYKLAQPIYGKILSIDPYNIDAIKLLGYSFEKNDQLNNALKCYRQWYKLQQNEYSLFALAEIFYKKNLDSDALNYYQQALELINHASPLLFKIYKNIGNIYVKIGDYDSAEENYNKAYTINPNSDVLLVNYGTLEIQKENFNLATEHFRNSIKINPQNDKAWTGLALIHYHLKDLKLAFGNIEKALDFNPDNKTALNLFIKWHLQEENINEPIKKLQEYLNNNYWDDQFSLVLAKLFTFKGYKEEAKIEIERALGIDPANMTKLASFELHEIICT